MAYRSQVEQPADLSHVMQSMEALDISSMRPDIQEAQGASASIKAKLVYRDEEELDTGLQKVQPLPFLDEEIQKYHAQIRESAEGARSVNDNVPTEVLQHVDGATTLAKEGMTSLFKASQLLEFTFDAYQYARLAAQDQFDLKRRSVQYLKQFEETFKTVIDCRMNADLAQADDEYEKCQASLERALAESRSDVQEQETRAGDEDGLVQEESLKETHEQVQDMVRMERSELSLIREQCVKDVQSINVGVGILQHHMKQAREQYEFHDNKRRTRLTENRAEQRDLEERLRRLREEEDRLDKDGRAGAQLQQQADEAYTVTEQDVQKWKSKIEGLKTRTDTSLSVMSCMEECTDIIMADAKKKKAHWNGHLKQLEVECLWTLRECLLIKGATKQMVLDDNKSNSAECRKLVEQYEKDKRLAARSGFGIRVAELKRSIEGYTAAKEGHDQKITECSEIIQQTGAELKALDERLRALRPRMKLDTLDNRYDELKRLRNEAFMAESTAGIAFNFYHKLPQ